MSSLRRTTRPHAAVALAAVAALAGATFLALPSPAGAASKRVVWLCKPGKDRNPCKRGLKTTLISPTGEKLGTKSPKGPRPRRIDCFYVYPTVSDQERSNATLHIDPEERSIALYQAARYSQHCRVFAPMYRQLTLQQIFDTEGITPRMLRIAYSSARTAWRKYMRKYNDGRGIVFIGHSQGTFILRELLAREVDDDPALRRQVVSALLLGGNVTVAEGSDTGGDFEHIPACRARMETGCVVAFSTFNDPVPDDAVFGRTSEPGQEVLCNNPASLRGGAGQLRSIYPSKPFAPDTSIGAVTRLVGFPVVDTKTRWIEADGAYAGRCSQANDADVLQITDQDGAPHLRALPNAAWGLHLADANIALGNQIGLVRHQIRAYVGS